MTSRSWSFGSTETTHGGDGVVTGARRHLTIVLPDGPILAPIEAMRAEWDPSMAAGVPAHVSVVYPEEITGEGLLLGRVGEATAGFRSVPLDIRGVVSAEESRGVFLGVTDRTGALTDLKSRLVAPPFVHSGSPLHVTIVHPRTSDRSSEAFAALEHDPISGSVTVTELAWTETSSAGMRVLRSFPLAPPRVQVVAGLLRRGDRVLLGHRRPTRVSFPDTWDLPGGHVEPGEHAAVALARELHEELGIAVRDVPDRPTTVVSDDAFDVDLSIWVLDDWHGEPVNAAPDEHDALEWCGPAEWSTRRLADPRYAALLDDVVRPV
jgi:8-oxo-dGTP pyrophosphatase MutT (NUDIX family)